MLLISKNADLELIPGDMTQPAENLYRIDIKF